MENGRRRPSRNESKYRDSDCRPPTCQSEPGVEVVLAEVRRLHLVAAAAVALASRQVAAAVAEAAAEVVRTEEVDRTIEPSPDIAAAAVVAEAGEREEEEEEVVVVVVR